MTTCILIISVLTGEVVGCLPPEKVMTMEQSENQWQRLEAALNQAKEKSK